MKHTVIDIYSPPICNTLPFFTMVYRAGIRSEQCYSLVGDEQEKRKEIMHFCT